MQQNYVKILFASQPDNLKHNGLFQKNPDMGGWGYGIPWGIKDIACGISGG